MEGRNEELTVLFSDVRDFTHISEALDPRELSNLMNAYLGAMTDVIRQRRGTLDKYIGDAIMAFWGAPVADPDHARNAVLTALAMQKELLKLAELFRARGWPELRVGVGINTGTMAVGDMGSPVRKAYTVIGDAVNLGARLESLTKQYGVSVMVGPLTRDRAAGLIFRELDWVRVKGKDDYVAIYEPLGLAGELSAERINELAIWQSALGLYRAQEWDQAEHLLRDLARRVPESRLYPIFRDRVARLRAHPPSAGWAGVTTFEIK
jgi:adenylate cyclase